MLHIEHPFKTAYINIVRVFINIVGPCVFSCRLAFLFNCFSCLQVFKYDRFLNDDMTVKDEFYKHEKRMKYHIMPWGLGQNACIGKQFAITTMKQ